jgi:flagellar assembly protein FliH
MGTVIRREFAGGKEAFSFADLESQARRIIEAARAHAQKIVDESESHIRQVTEDHKEQGYKAGYAEGEKAGFEQARQDAREEARQDARAELDQLIAALTISLEDFEQQKRALIALAESGLIELAVSIARRVCKVSVPSVDAVTANMAALLELVQHHHDVEFRLNPEDHTLVELDASEFAKLVQDLSHFKLVADENVARGGCVLRTAEGEMNAELDGQLDRIAALLCPPDADRPRASRRSDGS